MLLESRWKLKCRNVDIESLFLVAGLHVEWMKFDENMPIVFFISSFECRICTGRNVLVKVLKLCKIKTKNFSQSSWRLVCRRTCASCSSRWTRQGFLPWCWRSLEVLSQFYYISMQMIGPGVVSQRFSRCLAFFFHN